jgi:predicted ATPase/class 3 adenylate cyclase
VPVFLLTDIEGSTQLWEKHQAAMGQALTRHDTILRELIEKYDGRIIKHTGDGIFAVFESGRPLHCALAIQQRFAREAWQPLPAMRIRMALNAGEAERRGNDYFGPAVNRVARLLPAGWGGQILLTAAAAHSAPLPAGASLKDLGHHVLQDLNEPQLIYTLLHPDLPEQSFPPLRSLPLQEHNLPPQPTHFIGRETELAQIQQRLGQADCRLLSLVGPGGIGKTRLAIQAAAAQLAFFEHGVYFVPLQPVQSVELAVPAIAEAIRFSFNGQQPPRTQLLNGLHDKQMLLVLDNFEQVVHGAALVAELLQHAPRLKLLVTSRERLNLAQESCLILRGMRFPQLAELSDELAHQFEMANYEAVRLFLQGARRIYPDFELVESDKAAMLRICRLVDGMPLAIEMAAAWVRMISLAEIAAEIEGSVDFLVSAEQDAPARHHSLRVVFDYLWNFLSESERGVLRRLALFSGGFERQAANVVAGASLFFLSALVDRALLRENVNGRYEMHELLRQYAAEKLQARASEKEQACRAHAGHFADLLHRNEPRLRGKGQRVALAQIGAEMGNVRLAWQWALNALRQDAADAVALATIERSAEGLFLFYETRSLFQEGKEMFGQAAAILAILPPEQDVATGTERTRARQQLLGKVVCRQGVFCHHQGFYARSGNLLQLALAEAHAHGNAVEEALALTYLGSAAYYQGDAEKARELLNQGLALFRQSERSWGLVFCLRLLGNVAYISGHFQEAGHFLVESLELARQINYRREVADNLNSLANLHCVLGEYVLAEQQYRQCRTIYEELSYRKGVGMALNNLAHVYSLLGRYRQAILLYQESLAVYRSHGMQFEMALALKNLGDVALLLGNFAEAEQYYHDSLFSNEATQNVQGVAYGYSNLGDAARACGDYDRAAYLYGEARARMEKTKCSGGLAHVMENLGTVARLQANYDESRRCYEQSLAIHRHNDNREGIGHLLNQLGLLALAEALLPTAIDYFEQGLAVFSEAGVSWGISASLNNLVDSALTLPDLEKARHHLVAALTLMQRLEAPPLTLQTLLRASAFLYQLAGSQPMKLSEAADSRSLATALVRVCCSHAAATIEIQERARTLLVTAEQQPPAGTAAPSAEKFLPDDLDLIVERLAELLVG